MSTATAELGNVQIELAADELIVRQGEQVTRLDLEPAPRAIELKVGGSSIKIDAAGITIKGLNVKIEGELSAEVKGGIQAGLHADGLTAIKGGLTAIQ
jgi:type VI secretion system secreted protein VgrG